MGLTFEIANIAGITSCNNLGVKSDHLPEPVANVCRLVWVNRAISEYRGAIYLNDFYGLLVILNAPINLQKMALQLMLHEKEHAILCFQAARSLGFDGNFELPAEKSQIEKEATENLLDILISAFLIGEFTALKLLLDTIRQIPASGYSKVLRKILKDEVLHAKIGARIIAYLRRQNPAWCPYPGDETIKQKIAQAVAVYRARDVVEPLETRMFHDKKCQRYMLECGLGDPTRFKELYFATLERDFFSDILSESENSLSQSAQR